LAGQAVAAQEVDVARLDGVGAFDVHLDERFRPEAAVDDVAGDVLDLVGVHVLEAGVLPDEAVVVAQLIDDVAADAITPAVADVPDPGPIGAEDERSARRAHALELAVLLAAGVDGGVGLDEGAAEGDDGPEGGVLLVDVGDDVGGLFAGLLADRVGTHPVGDEEEVAALLPALFIAGELNGEAVLIVAALDAHVGQTAVFDLVESHQGSPNRGMPSRVVGRVRSHPSMVR